MDIPHFLMKMSLQLNTQDNRITADPIWMVCYDKAHVTADGYHEYTEYAVSDGDYCLVYSTEDGTICDNDYAIRYLLENHDGFCERWCDENEAESFQEFNFENEIYDLPKGIEEFHVRREQEVVKACLTESDAKYFIKRKQHDYPKLYTYVFSMCYCPQMIELRQWIMSLTKGDV